MKAEMLASKYISCAEQVLTRMQIAETPSPLNADSVRTVLDQAKTYLEDAKYYRAQSEFEVSLTSVAYCEGLLDALKLLGAVRFEWPTKPAGK